MIQYLVFNDVLALSSFLYKIYSDEPEKALICVYRIEFYLAVGFFLVCLIGFATRPPSPPSSLAAMGNLWERAGVPSPRNSTANLISRCFKNKTFSIVVIPSSLAVAAWINWSNSFTLILHSYGKAEDFSGALASFTTLISIGGGILIARIADIFHFTRSSIIVLMSIMGSIGSLWFALTVQFISSDLTISSVCLFLSAGLVGLTAGASFPLFYEEAAAIAYPISSGITSGIFLFTMSIFMTGGFVLGALGPQNESYFTYVHAVLWLITAVMVWIFHDHVDRDFESQAIIEAIRTNGRFTYDFSFIEEIFEKQELLLDSDYISEED